ncbi:MAG: hypothetical protein WKG03_12870 [Telluria sp.]
MSKKKYPIVSMFVAVVWAVFFYPADREPSKPVARKAVVAVPKVAVTAPSRMPHPGMGPDQRTAALATK